MVSVPNIRLKDLALTAAMACALTAPVASHAALGDDVQSIERDRSAFSGTLSVRPELTYDVHEITTPTGKVREYLAAGRVFAVAWNGHAVPDLGQLLGVHVREFHDLVRPQPGNHHIVSVGNDQLTVSLRQYPRGVEGHVVMPALVPSGVALAALR